MISDTGFARFISIFYSYIFHITIRFKNYINGFDDSEMNIQLHGDQPVTNVYKTTDEKNERGTTK